MSRARPIDRHEPGEDGLLPAEREVQEALGLPVVAVLRLKDLMTHLETAGEAAILSSVRAYRDRYGV